MTRDGTEADIPAVIEMAREFWQHTMYTEDFDAEQVEFMTRLALSQGLLAVLEVEGKVEGFTAGISGPLLANGATLVATEIAWWVNPAARRGRHSLDLLNHIEAQAKAAGVKYWTMVTMQSCAPEVASRIYLSRGYKHSETSYTRIL